MTIKVVVTVPQSEPRGVIVRRTPVDAGPYPDEHRHHVDPGQTAEFNVWQGSAIQVSEK